jgi:hypothetical protein
MKHILTTAILTAMVVVAQADDGSATEKAGDTANAVVAKAKEALVEADRATRTAWAKTTAYLSNEVDVYREGGNKTLADLATEITKVKAQTPSDAPAYFRTRLLALDEQREYLAKRLALLSPEHLKDRSSGPRHDFDQCVGDLEQAIDRAKEDAVKVAKMTLDQP